MLKFLSATSLSGKSLTGMLLTGTVLFSLFLLWQCAPKKSTQKPAYSFFVVGHAYGNPIHYQYGIYPPLQSYFEQLNQKEDLAFGVLTGDVVPKNTQAYWDSAYSDISQLNMPVHIAPGNHDRGEVFDKKVNPAHYAFKNGDDLFLVLDTEDWQVEGKQKEFFFNAIESIEYIRNLFIFSHELVWWSPKNKYSEIEINYRPHYPGGTNFWNELLPDLQQLNCPVIWFAGDVGSKPECTPVSFSEEGNVMLVSNGVGSGTQDNVIIVDISDQGDVSFRIIHINDPRYPLMGSVDEFRF